MSTPPGPRPEAPTAGWQVAMPALLLLGVFGGVLAWQAAMRAAPPRPAGPGDAPEGMVRVPSEPAFWIDQVEVTNVQFARFVAATGHVTRAEKAGAEATWRKPEGAGSSIEARGAHPVVQVAREDAEAYARWAGSRLPTPEEWERAARAGRTGGRFLWGDETKPGGRWPANLWQGEPSKANRAEDGYLGTSPARSFPPNAWGIYEMPGNAWEWCAGPVAVRLGGSFLSPDPAGPLRAEVPDGAPSRDTGFRCVR